jgi:hypothetical protein
LDLYSLDEFGERQEFSDSICGESLPHPDQESNEPVKIGML